MISDRLDVIFLKFQTRFTNLQNCLYFLVKIIKITDTYHLQIPANLKIVKKSVHENPLANMNVGIII